jgi:TolB protein
MQREEPRRGIRRGLLFDSGAGSIPGATEELPADSKEGFTASTITFSRWADVGAEALVKVQLSVDGKDLRGEMRLFTVSSGKEDLRLVHVEPVDRPRRLAHFFADALYKQFTREPGPFQSHLAFVRRTSKGKDVYLGDWDGRRGVAQGNNLLPR